MAASRDLKQLKAEAQAALARQDWPTGAKILAEWCRLRPDDSRGWYYRAFFAMKMGRIIEAQTHAEKALTLDPQHQDTQKLLTLLKRTPRAPVKKTPKDTGGSWQAGEVVEGRYEIKDSKRGGMGEVYFAYDRQLEHMVAIKAPLPALMTNPNQRARFYREAEAWVGLGMHPHICTAYYVQEIGNLPWLFIEYIGGGTLDEWLKHKAQSFSQKLDVAIQIASGMGHTHAFIWMDEFKTRHRGLVHRDLKPANILMEEDGTAKVTDFGLVGLAMELDKASLDKVWSSWAETGGSAVDEANHDKSANWSDQSDQHWRTVTLAGGAVGTPPYMAPEQWQSAHAVGSAVDIYAYGCILYEVFCGRRPFQLPEELRHAMPAHKLFQWERLHLEADPPDPRTLVPEIDETLAELMQRCLRKDPLIRPESFEKIRETLKTVYAQVTGQAYPRPEPRKYRLLADSLNNQGVSFLTVGQPRRAEDAFKEALKTDPHHVEATYNQAMYEWKYFGLSQEEVISRMEEVGRTHPAVSRHKHLMGRMFLFFGEYTRAVTYLKDAAKLGETGVEILKDLGLALLAQSGGRDQGEWTEAEECLEQVMKLGSKDPAVATGYALALWYQGRYEEALVSFTRTSRQSSDLAPDLERARRQVMPGQEMIQTIHHVGLVNLLTFTPDSQQVICGGENRLSFWPLQDSSGGPPIRGDLTTAMMADLSMRPMRGTSAAAGPVGADWPIDLKPSRQFKETFLQGGPFLAWALSRDGRRALAGSADGLVRLWELETGVSRIMSGHTQGVRAVAFSPDGEYAISGGLDRAIRLWETTEGKCVEVLEGHTEPITALAFSPDGRRAASAGEDKTIRIWDTYLSVAIYTLEGHTGPITALAFSPEEDFLISASQDMTVRLWHAGLGKCFHTFEGHKLGVTAVAFGHGGRLVLSASDDKTLRLWDIKTRRRERIFRLDKRVEGLTVSPDGHLVALSLANITPPDTKTICLMSSPSPDRYRQPYVVTKPISSAVADAREQDFTEKIEGARQALVAEDYQRAHASLSQARAIPGYERDQEALVIWTYLTTRFSSRRLRSAWEIEILEGHQAGVTAVAIEPQGHYLLSGARDKTVRLWEIRSGTSLNVLEGHTGPVGAVSFYGQGQWAISGSQDNSLRLWDLREGQTIRVFLDHTGEVTTVAASPDGRWAISGGRDGRLIIWDLVSQIMVKPLASTPGYPTAAAIAQDGSYAVSSDSENNLYLWSLEKGIYRRVLKGHTRPVRAVAICPDGQHVMSGGEDGVIFRWEVTSEVFPEVYKGHLGPVNALAVCPDSKYIISGGEDRTICLWELKTGNCLRTFEGHAGPITAVAFSPDRQFIVSASLDKTIRLWRLDWEPEVRSPEPWDDGAKPFLEIFLKTHTISDPNRPSRTPKPQWEEADFQALLQDLANRGFGWLLPSGVLIKLKEMAGLHRSLREIITVWRDRFKALNLRQTLQTIFKGVLKIVLRLLPATAWSVLLLKHDLFGLSPILAVLTTLFFTFIMFLKKSK